MLLSEKTRPVPRIALTYEEAADAVGVSETQLKNWVRAGSLPVSDLSERCPRIYVNDLHEFVQNHKRKESANGVGIEEQKDKK